MLVAYTVFGDCNTELANVGVPSGTPRPCALIVAACRRLKHAVVALPARDDAQPGPPSSLAAGRACAERRRRSSARGRERLARLRARGARDTDAREPSRSRSRARRRPAPPRPRGAVVRTAIGLAFLAFVLGNIAVIVWIWVANHNLDFRFAPDLTSAGMARLGGLTGPARRLPRARPGAAARAAAVPRAGRRLRPADRLAPLERLRRACSLVLAHTVLAVYGYAIDRHIGFFDEFWTLVADDFLPGMVTATIGLALFVLVTVTSIVIVAPAPPLRALVRRAPHRVRGDRARVVPPDPDRRRPRPLQPGRGDATGASSSSGRSRCSLFRVLSPSGRRVRYRLRVAEVIAEAPERHLDPDHRPRARQAARAAGAVLPLALPDARVLVDGAPVLALGRARRPVAPDQRQGRRRPHRRGCGTIPVGTRVVAEGPFGDVHRGVVRRGTRCC